MSKVFDMSRVECVRGNLRSARQKAANIASALIVLTGVQCISAACAKNTVVYPLTQDISMGAVSYVSWTTSEIYPYVSSGTGTSQAGVEKPKRAAAPQVEDQPCREHQELSWTTVDCGSTYSVYTVTHW